MPAGSSIISRPRDAYPCFVQIISSSVSPNPTASWWKWASFPTPLALTTESK